MQIQLTRKRFRRLLLFLTVLAATALAVMAGINEYVKSYARGYILSAEQAAEREADCILVLGSWVSSGGSPGPILKDRLDQGILLYEAGASNRLLMSGDHGRASYDEVNGMKQYAIDAGIRSEHIFMDHAGFSTYESMYRARDIFEVESMLIVTQEYHLYRSLYIARRMGIDSYGVSSGAGSNAGRIVREARESLARVKDFFTVMFEPKPTFLGEAIPVSGNGDLTNG